MHGRAFAWASAWGTHVSKGLARRMHGLARVVRQTCVVQLGARSLAELIWLCARAPNLHAAGRPESPAPPQPASPWPQGRRYSDTPVPPWRPPSLGFGTSLAWRCSAAPGLSGAPPGQRASPPPASTFPRTPRKMCVWRADSSPLPRWCCAWCRAACCGRRRCATPSHGCACRRPGGQASTDTQATRRTRMLSEETMLRWRPCF